MNINSLQPKPLVTETENHPVIDRNSQGRLAMKRSLGEHYQNKIDVVMDSFQERKDKIDQEIRAIKKAKHLSINVKPEIRE